MVICRDPRRREIFETTKKFAILKETGDTQGHDDAAMRQFPTRPVPATAAAHTA
jgi:hypothetical protein